MLYDRLEMKEWSMVGSIGDWLHRMLLQFESTYDPYINYFLFAFRNLVDMNRDLIHDGITSSNNELYEMINRLMPLLGE